MISDHEVNASVSMMQPCHYDIAGGRYLVHVHRNNSRSRKKAAGGSLATTAHLKGKTERDSVPWTES